MDTKRILYYVSTAVMSLIFLYSAFMYFTKYEMVTGFFQALEFPTWLVYPLAIAKVIGILTIWVKPKKVLVEWAYAGFFFDVILALVSHSLAGHGIINLALLALIVTIVSRVFYGILFLKIE